MPVPEDAAFEVLVTKRAGDGFRVTVERAPGTISERDAVRSAIDLLVLHLENESGLRSWAEGVDEGLRRASG